MRIREILHRTYIFWYSHKKIYYGSFIVISLLAFLLLSNGKYLLGGDMEFADKYTKVYIDRVLYNWIPDQGFGSSNWTIPSYSLVYFVQGMFAQIFGMQIGQLLFYFVLLLIPALLFLNISIRINRSYIASFIFAFILIFSYQIQIANALLLPYLMIRNIAILLSIYYLIKNKKSYLSWELIVIFFLSTIIAKNQADFLVFMTLFFIGIFFQKLFFQKDISWKRFIVRSGIQLLIVFAINMNWLLPFVSEYSRNIGLYLGDSWNVQTLAVSSVYLWKDAGIVNFIRGLSHDFFLIWNGTDTYFYSSLFKNDVYSFLSFTPLLFVLRTVMVAKRKGKTYSGVILLFTLNIFSLSLLMGASSPFTNLSSSLLGNTIFTLLFRNPTTRFLNYYAITTYLLVTVGLGYIKKLSYKNIIAAFFLAIYILPIVISGDLLNNRNEFSLQNYSDYSRVCRYINDDSSVGRVLIFPVYDSTLIRLNSGNELYDILKQCSSKGTWSLGTNYNSPYNRDFWKYISDNIYNDNEYDLGELYKYGITDIIWHKDVSFENMKNGIEANRKLGKWLSENKKLNKVEETDNLIVYKILYDSPQLPVILSSNLKYDFIDPTKYVLHFNHISNFKDTNIVFNQSYNRAFVILSPNSTIFDTLNSTKYLFEDSHILVNKFANQWTISINTLKESVPYTTNSDGTINFDLVLLYSPQSLVYIGNTITVFTMVVSILSLFFNGLRYFYKKKERKDLQLTTKILN